MRELPDSFFAFVLCIRGTLAKELIRRFDRLRVYVLCAVVLCISHRRESPLIELSEEFSSTRAYSLFVSQRIERRMYTPCLPRVVEIGGAQSSFAAMCVCATTTRRVYDGQRGSFAINFAFDSRADCIDAAIACAACRTSAYKHIA